MGIRSSFDKVFGDSNEEKEDDSIFGRLKGPTGPRGPRGPSGRSGRPTAPGGRTSITGPSGPRGRSGPEKPDGPRGAAGRAGEQAVEAIAAEGEEVDLDSIAADIGETPTLEGVEGQILADAGLGEEALKDLAGQLLGEAVEGE